MNFSSENFDSVHPAIWKSLSRSNKGFAPSYGQDEISHRLTSRFQDMLNQKDIALFLCFNGTGANNFALSALTQPHQAIYCSDVSHLYTAESTSPEALTGCRLYALPSVQGKIDPAGLVPHLNKRNSLHTPGGSVLTITQPTEYGTVYSMDELAAIARICKDRGLYLHIDGARVFNALAAMNCSLRQLLEVSRADAITMGGTKSGLMFGEAVLFVHSSRFHHLDQLHKRSTQLASKARFIAAQFESLLENDRWHHIASHSNSLAKYFEQKITSLPGAALAYPVETNVVFLEMKPVFAERLQRVASFYIWDREKNETRFIFSFSNSKKEIDLFAKTFTTIAKM
jgi:threonine aldolase